MTLPAPAALHHLGVLAIDGPDAATFLQGQATCDTRALSDTHGALGALCNLQGRMIVSFYMLPAADGLRLVMPRDRVDAVLAHLKKYAVFSKVTLRDDTPAYTVSSEGGDGEPFALQTRDGALRMFLRGGRALGLRPAASTLPDGSATWRAASIAAGELLVDTANADQYLPQALNYDVIDGVSFRKGCYTGQEVVARMHFKGKMKERLYVCQAAGAVAPEAGSPVTDADGRTVGTVVDAVARDGDCFVGAVIRHEAVAAGGLRLAGGQPVTVGAAPYSLPA